MKKMSAFLACLLLAACAERGAAEKYLKQALACYQRRDFVGSELNAARALSADGRLAEARFLRGKALFFQRRFDEACREFDTLARRVPEHVGAQLWLARARLILHRDLSESEADLSAAALRDEENVGLWFVLGQIKEARGETERALECYGRGLVYEKEAAAQRERCAALRKNAPRR